MRGDPLFGPGRCGAPALAGQSDQRLRRGIIAVLGPFEHLAEQSAGRCLAQRLAWELPPDPVLSVVALVVDMATPSAVRATLTPSVRLPPNAGFAPRPCTASSATRGWRPTAHNATVWLRSRSASPH
jgi:hypothetical protein